MRGGVLGGRLVGLHGVRAQGFVVRARLERLFLRLSGRFAGRANERPSGEARGWEWVWVGERRPSTTSVDLQAPVDPLRTTTWQHSCSLTVLFKCAYHRDCTYFNIYVHNKILCMPLLMTAQRYPYDMHPSVVSSELRSALRFGHRDSDWQYVSMSDVDRQ